MFFKEPKKKENPSVAEEIKITQIRNYYNDSLENEPDNDEEEEEEEIEENKVEENQNNIKVEETIEVKKNDISSKEIIKNSSILESKKESNKEEENEIIDDKTSYCHFFLFDGEDIDITGKKVIKCYQQTNNIMLLKNITKVKKLVFIEEPYLYVLHDQIVDKNDQRIRRVARKFDLSKLFSIETKEENKRYVFKFQLLRGDYFERETKFFVFEKKEGKLFHDLLYDTLDNIESTFFGFSDDEYEEEEEEEDDDDVDKIGSIEDSMKDADMSVKRLSPMGFNNNDDLISSSRKKII